MKFIFGVLCYCVICNVFGQEKRLQREGFELVIPVKGKVVYKDQIKPSPYFVTGTDLQLYPTEQVFIEVVYKDSIIHSMKAVETIEYPERTIVIEFHQETKSGKSEVMTLKVVNPFTQTLIYKALMYTIKAKDWSPITTLPVKGKSTGYEIWNEVIIALVLKDWELVSKTD